jgi:hypothetical protein
MQVRSAVNGAGDGRRAADDLASRARAELNKVLRAVAGAPPSPVRDRLAERANVLSAALTRGRQEQRTAADGLDRTIESVLPSRHGAFRHVGDAARGLDLARRATSAAHAAADATREVAARADDLAASQDPGSHGPDRLNTLLRDWGTADRLAVDGHTAARQATGAHADLQAITATRSNHLEAARAHMGRVENAMPALLGGARENDHRVADLGRILADATTLAGQAAAELSNTQPTFNGLTTQHGATSTTILSPSNMSNRNHAATFPPVAGRHRVFAHGNDITSARDLADAILQNPGWRGEPVDIIVCDLASGSEGPADVAQELAQLLGVPVTAATATAWTSTAGHAVVGAATLRADGRPELGPATGEWVTYHPRTDGSEPRVDHEGPFLPGTSTDAAPTGGWASWAGPSAADARPYGRRPAVDLAGYRTHATTLERGLATHLDSLPRVQEAARAAVARLRDVLTGPDPTGLADLLRSGTLADRMTALHDAAPHVGAATSGSPTAQALATFDEIDVPGGDRDDFVLATAAWQLGAGQSLTDVLAGAGDTEIASDEDAYVALGHHGLPVPALRDATGHVATRWDEEYKADKAVAGAKLLPHEAVYWEQATRREGGFLAFTDGMIDGAVGTMRSLERLADESDKSDPPMREWLRRNEIDPAALANQLTVVHVLALQNFTSNNFSLINAVAPGLDPTGTLLRMTVRQRINDIADGARDLAPALTGDPVIAELKTELDELREARTKDEARIGDLRARMHQRATTITPALAAELRVHYDMALDVLPYLPHAVGGSVKRGDWAVGPLSGIMSAATSALTGKKITFAKLTSTSRHQAAAEEFTKQYPKDGVVRHPVLYDLALDGRAGYDIEGLSEMDEEGEVFFPPGSAFDRTDRSVVHGRYELIEGVEAQPTGVAAGLDALTFRLASADLAGLEKSTRDDADDADRLAARTAEARRAMASEWRRTESGLSAEVTQLSGTAAQAAGAARDSDRRAVKMVRDANDEIGRVFAAASLAAGADPEVRRQIGVLADQARQLAADLTRIDRQRQQAAAGTLQIADGVAQEAMAANRAIRDARRALDSAAELDGEAADAADDARESVDAATEQVREFTAYVSAAPAARRRTADFRQDVLGYWAAAATTAADGREGRKATRQSLTSAERLAARMSAHLGAAQAGIAAAPAGQLDTALRDHRRQFQLLQRQMEAAGSLAARAAAHLSRAGIDETVARPEPRAVLRPGPLPHRGGRPSAAAARAPQSVPGGVMILPPADTTNRRAAAAFPADPGAYRVFAHGRDLTDVQALRRAVEADPAWRGRPVVLVVCDGAAEPTNVARQLSRLLRGTPVTASTGTVWTSGNGHAVAAGPALDAQGRPVLGAPAAEWVTYETPADGETRTEHHGSHLPGSTIAGSTGLPTAGWVRWTGVRPGGRRPALDLPTYHQHASRFEQRLATDLNARPRVAAAARATVQRLREVLTRYAANTPGAEPLKAFVRDDPASAGQVGDHLDDAAINDLIDNGTVREQMTALFNATYFNDATAERPTLKAVLADVVGGRDWQRSDALGLDTAALRTVDKKLRGLSGRTLRTLAGVLGRSSDFAQDLFVTDHVVGLTEKGHSQAIALAQSLKGRGLRQTTGDPDANAGVFGKALPRYLDAIGVPLSPREREYHSDHVDHPFVADPSRPTEPTAASLSWLAPGQEGPELPLPWSTGASRYDIDTASAWYERTHDQEGKPVVAGLSVTTARLMRAFDWLGVPGVDRDDFLLATAAWMMPVVDHSLFEIMRGAEMVGAGTVSDTTSAEDMYLGLGHHGIPSSILREVAGHEPVLLDAAKGTTRHVSGSSLLPHEAAYWDRATRGDGGFAAYRPQDLRNAAAKLDSLERIIAGEQTEADAPLSRWLDTHAIDPEALAEQLNVVHVLALRNFTSDNFSLINAAAPGYDPTGIKTRQTIKFRVDDIIATALDPAVKKDVPPALQADPEIARLTKDLEALRGRPLDAARVEQLSRAMHQRATAITPALMAEMRVHFDMALDALPLLPRVDGDTLHRGDAGLGPLSSALSKGASALTGSTFSFSRLTSTSRNARTADRFAGKIATGDRSRHPVMYHLRATGRAGYDSAGLSNHDEAEVTYAPGSTFTETSRTVVPGRYERISGVETEPTGVAAAILDGIVRSATSDVAGLPRSTRDDADTIAPLTDRIYAAHRRLLDSSQSGADLAERASALRRAGDVAARSDTDNRYATSLVRAARAEIRKVQEAARTATGPDPRLDALAAQAGRLGDDVTRAEQDRQEAAGAVERLAAQVTADADDATADLRHVSRAMRRAGELADGARAAGEFARDGIRQAAELAREVARLDAVPAGSRRAAAHVDALSGHRSTATLLSLRSRQAAVEAAEAADEIDTLDRDLPGRVRSATARVAEAERTQATLSGEADRQRRHLDGLRHRLADARRLADQVTAHLDSTGVGPAAPTAFAGYDPQPLAHGVMILPPDDRANRRAARRFPTDPAKHHVFAHGEHLTDAAALARIVRDDPDWDGKPVVLVVCGSAAPSTGIARELSRLLGGTPVTAPTGTAWTSDAGHAVAAGPALGADGRPVLGATASEWVTHHTPAPDAEPQVEHHGIHLPGTSTGALPATGWARWTGPSPSLARPFGRRPVLDLPTYHQHAAAFEQGIGRHLNGLSRPQRAVGAALQRLREVLTAYAADTPGAEPLRSFLRDDPASPGQVGDQLTDAEVDGLIDDGTSREQLTALLNAAAVNDASPGRPTFAAVLADIVASRDWQRADALGLNTVALREAEPKLAGQGPLTDAGLLALSPDSAAHTGAVAAAALARRERTTAAAAGQVTPQDLADAGAPLSPREQAYLDTVDDETLPWSTGASRYEFDTAAPWYQQTHDREGKPVVGGVSLDTARLMRVFDWLAVPGVDRADFLAGVTATALTTNTHSLHEVLHGAAIAGAGTGADQPSAEEMYLGLGSLGLHPVVLRRLVSGDGMLPHEAAYWQESQKPVPAYGSWGYDDPKQAKAVVEAIRRIANGLDRPTGPDEEEAGRRYDAVAEWLHRNDLDAGVLATELTPAHVLALQTYTQGDYSLVNAVAPGIDPTGVLARQTIRNRADDLVDKALHPELDHKPVAPALWRDTVISGLIDELEAIRDKPKNAAEVSGIRAKVRKRAVERLPAVLAEMRAHFDMVVDTLQLLPRATGGPLFRGDWGGGPIGLAPLVAAVSRGGTFSFAKLTGTTPTKQTAEWFTKQYAKSLIVHRRMYELEPDGLGGVDVSGLSSEPDERERLFLPGTTFKELDRAVEPAGDRADLGSSVTVKVKEMEPSGIAAASIDLLVHRTRADIASAPVAADDTVDEVNRVAARVAGAHEFIAAAIDDDSDEIEARAPQVRRGAEEAGRIAADLRRATVQLGRDVRTATDRVTDALRAARRARRSDDTVQRLSALARRAESQNRAAAALEQALARDYQTTGLRVSAAVRQADMALNRLAQAEEAAGVMGPQAAVAAATAAVARDTAMRARETSRRVSEWLATLSSTDLRSPRHVQAVGRHRTAATRALLDVQDAAATVNAAAERVGAAGEAAMRLTSSAKAVLDIAESDLDNLDADVARHRGYRDQLIGMRQQVRDLARRAGALADHLRGTASASAAQPQPDLEFRPLRHGASILPVGDRANQDAARDFRTDPAKVYFFFHGRDDVSAEQLAEVILDNPRWRGRPVVLVACDTGTAPRDTARQLSRLLPGIPVTAPTGTAWTNGSGRAVVAGPALDPHGRPVLGATGDRWITFITPEGGGTRTEDHGPACPTRRPPPRRPAIRGCRGPGWRRFRRTRSARPSPRTGPYRCRRWSTRCRRTCGTGSRSARRRTCPRRPAPTCRHCSTGSCPSWPRRSGPGSTGSAGVRSTSCSARAGRIRSPSTADRPS